MTPDGSFLYVTNFGSNTVSGYVIGSSGLLTPLSTSSYVTGPAVIAVSPSGSFLYVSNDSGSGIFAYAIGPGGLLTPLSTPTFATGASPQAIAIAP